MVVSALPRRAELPRPTPEELWNAACGDDDNEEHAVPNPPSASGFRVCRQHTPTPPTSLNFLPRSPLPAPHSHTRTRTPPQLTEDGASHDTVRGLRDLGLLPGRTAPCRPCPPQPQPQPPVTVTDGNSWEPTRTAGGDDNAAAAAAAENGALSPAVASHAFEAAARELDVVWAEAGVDAAHRGAAAAALWGGVSELLREAVRRELLVADALRTEAAEEEAAVRRLETLLAEPAAAAAEASTLTERRAFFAARRAALEKEHDERQECFEVAARLCDELGATTRLPPGGQHEELSVATLEACVAAANEAAAGRERALRATVDGHMAAVRMLWEKLRVGASERTAFEGEVERALGCDGGGGGGGGARATTVAAVRAWVGRPLPQEEGALAAALCGCERLQEAAAAAAAAREALEVENRERMRLQVQETRGLLEALCTEYQELTGDERFAVQSAQASEGEPTEATLSIVEGEVLYMERRVEAVQGVAKLLQRREEIQRQRAEMEAASKDGSRLTDRSRNMAQVLLQEERVRKAVKKELPKVERQLAAFCRRYREENNGEEFMYKGAALEAQMGEEGNGGEQQRAETAAPAAAAAAAAPQQRAGRSRSANRTAGGRAGTGPSPKPGQRSKSRHA